MEELDFKDSEKLKDAEKLLSDAKKNGAATEIYKSLFSLLNLYEDAYDYESIPDLVDEYILLFNSPKEKLELLNKKITALLKLEEYNELIKTLEIKNELDILSDTEKTNILFYKAIAYEALDEADLAIKSLESIMDNISRYSLVNKYLKLSMLYLKVNRMNEAKEAYEYASKIDYNHKNDMFLLVESDLFYAAGKYLEALESFETFFLRSANKYKYLDRYILINMKLNRIDDAYNFYLNYKNKTQLRLSKGNKYSFYKAASLLLSIMNKKNELDEVNALLEGIKPVYFRKEETENEKIIDSIIKGMGAPLTVYDKRKNIINRFFKLLNGIKKNNLVYIEYANDKYLYSRFDNTQMREKEILISDVLTKELTGYFEFKEDTVLDYFYDNNFNKVEDKAKVYLIKNEYYNYGYFIVSYSERYDYVYSLLREVLLETFIKLDLITKNNNDFTSVMNILSREHYGFIRFNKDTVEFLSKESKDLFHEKNTVVKLSDFMPHFLTPLHLDELRDKDEVILDAIIDNETCKMDFRIYNADGVIYAIVKEVKEELELKERNNSFYYSSDSGFLNNNALKDEVESRLDSYAIIGMYIKLIEETDSLSLRDEKLNELSKIMKEISPSSRIYYLGENHYLYLLYTVDKRTLESIYNRTIENLKYLYKYSYSLRENEPVGFISKSLKNKTYTDVKELIEYGYFYSISKNKLITLDNEEKRDYALFKTYESEILKRIRDNDFELNYYPVVNESTKMIHYFLIENEYPYGLDYATYRKVINKNQLETKSDSNFIEKLLSEIKDLNKGLKFIIRIEKESVSNPNFIKKLSALYKGTKLDGKIILFTDNESNKDFKKGLQSIKNMGIPLMTSYNYDEIDKSRFDDFDFIAMKNNNDELSEYIIKGFMNVLKKKVIITSGDHIENTLSLKSELGVYKKDKLLKF